MRVELNVAELFFFYQGIEPSVCPSSIPENQQEFTLEHLKLFLKIHGAISCLYLGLRYPAEPQVFLLRSAGATPPWGSFSSLAPYRCFSLPLFASCHPFICPHWILSPRPHSPPLLSLLGLKLFNCLICGPSLVQCTAG